MSEFRKHFKNNMGQGVKPKIPFQSPNYKISKTWHRTQQKILGVKRNFLSNSPIFPRIFLRPKQIQHAARNQSPETTLRYHSITNVVLNDLHRPPVLPMLHHAGTYFLSPSLSLSLIIFVDFGVQVKQKKKSSNKWSCAVCNQKQSVQKVFAQGFMAKDLRKFVQNFNMSRKFVDDGEWLLAGTLDPPSEHRDGEPELPVNQTKKRRTDWTAYLDQEDHPNHIIKGAEQEQEG